MPPAQKCVEKKCNQHDKEREDGHQCPNAPFLTVIGSYQLTLLKVRIYFLIYSVPSTRLTYHDCLLYHLKKVKCSSDTELSNYKGKILSYPQKCPEENLNYEINLVLCRHSAVCFLLCIKNSWPSVIDKEPISFYLSSVLKREEMVTEGKLC